eukprot:gene5541-6900_t
MKRIQIFQLSTSTLFTKDYQLEINHTHTIVNSITNSSNNTISSSPLKQPPPPSTTTTTTTITTDNNIISSTNNNLGEFDHLCNACLQRFTDKELRNQHYRSPIHRYNLKLKLAHLPPISELEYRNLLETAKAEEEDNTSSSDDSTDNEDNSDDASGSSSSEDDEHLLNPKIKPKDRPELIEFYDTPVDSTDPKVKFVQKELKLQLSVWRCLLAAPNVYKTMSDQQLIDTFKSYSLSKNMKWAVLICSGGRFAGAIYTIGGKCLDHKTYHRYTTRKKQGGSQSSKDSQSGVRKSAGASMRRYNEKRLREEVAELLGGWRQHFKECSHIFVSAPKGNTRDILFPPGGFIQQDDQRIRTIPFPVIRPTYSETQRISNWITSVDIDLFDEEKELVERQEHEKRLEQHKKRLEKEKRTVEWNEGHMNDEKSGTNGKNNENDSTKEETKEPAQQSNYELDPLFEATKQRDFEKVKYLLEEDENYELPVPTGNDSIITPLFIAVENKDIKLINYLVEFLSNEINTRIPRWSFRTALHKAAAEGSLEIIKILLNNGADPTVEGLHSDTAYDMSANQKTRDLFREWAGDNLDKWDYNKAHIQPLTRQMKEDKEERKKQKRKNQREKEKLKKKAEKEQREIEEKQKLEDDKLKHIRLEELKITDQVKKEKDAKEALLTDREKRALAAERRMTGTTSFKQCEICKSTIPGVPFERLNYIYCSTVCVLAHKKQLNPESSSTTSSSPKKK